MNETRDRPDRSLPSRTEKIRAEMDKLYLAVMFDENDRPFEVFGWIGKTELACRLLAPHLRRGIPIERNEVVLAKWSYRRTAFGRFAGRRHHGLQLEMTYCVWHDWPTNTILKSGTRRTEQLAS